MAIPRPKILSVVTVPTGGWQLRFKLSVAVQYDTTATATVAAGDYFMACDNQSDDFIRALTVAMRDAAKTALASAQNDQVSISIDPDTHRTIIAFIDAHYSGAPGQDVKIEWTQLDGDDIAAVLGFDSSADDTSAGSPYPLFSSDWDHAYGWYANEDGLLRSLLVEDRNESDVQMVVTLAGNTRAVGYGQRFQNQLDLQYLTRARTFSRDVGYGSTPLHPYSRNIPLECWWEHVRTGKRFRVYRDGYVTAARAAESAAFTSDTTTTLTDSARTWSTEPQRWKGALLWIPEFHTLTGTSAGYYISSNTATVLTVANAHPSGYDVGGAGAGTYRIYDHRYQTYVVDLTAMSRFEPEEIEALDRYNISIPLLRYVA